MNPDREHPRSEAGAEAYARAQQSAQQILTMISGGRWHLPDDAADAESAAPYQPDAALASALDELETVRQQIGSRITALALRNAAIGALLGLAFWLALWLLVHLNAHARAFGFENLLLFSAVGAIWGYVQTVKNLNNAYGQLYKQRVLPKLAAGFGDLNWRPAQPPLDEFKHYRLFPNWDEAHAADEIHGHYHGMALSIFDLRLRIGSGKTRRVIFNGIVIALTLPRQMRGVTVVTPQGESSSFAEHLRDGLQPVHLENPAFAKTFQIYASDQVSARALLTPAFMERFLNLAAAYGIPQALAQDQRFITALPALGGLLFSPPSYRDPAAARATMTRLHQGIAACLRTADAVIDLDQSARQKATQAAQN